MKAEKLKEMMEACYIAKRIRDLLPTLPEGVAPSYIRFIDVISKLHQTNEYVTISAIGDFLKLPRPGVTRTIKEMEKKGYIRKIISEEDARFIYIEITEIGAALHDKYNVKYFNELSTYLGDISDEEADCMISTINKLYKNMYER